MAEKRPQHWELDVQLGSLPPGAVGAQGRLGVGTTVWRPPRGDSVWCWAGRAEGQVVSPLLLLAFDMVCLGVCGAGVWPHPIF